MAKVTDCQDSIGIDDINEGNFNLNNPEKDFVEREAEEEDRDMAPVGGVNSIHRSSSRPQLDLSGAAIQGNFEEKDPAILLPNQSDDISHLALDIGGKSFVFLLSFSSFPLNECKKLCVFFIVTLNVVLVCTVLLLF